MITIYFERDSDLPEPVCYKSVADAVDWICDGYPTYRLDGNVLFGIDNRKFTSLTTDELQTQLNEIRANAIADTQHDYSLAAGA